MPQSTFKTIDSLDVAGKRVLVRLDLNVPMKNGKVTDATRIERAAPTVAELANKGARVVVLSHFGRPDGKRVPEMSLRPLVEPLAAPRHAAELLPDALWARVLGRVEDVHERARAALACRTDENLELLTHLVLSHVFVQQFGTQGSLQGLFLHRSRAG